MADITLSCLKTVCEVVRLVTPVSGFQIKAMYIDESLGPVVDLIDTKNNFYKVCYRCRDDFIEEFVRHFYGDRQDKMTIASKTLSMVRDQLKTVRKIRKHYKQLLRSVDFKSLYVAAWVRMKQFGHTPTMRAAMLMMEDYMRNELSFPVSIGNEEANPFNIDISYMQESLPEDVELIDVEVDRVKSITKKMNVFE